MIVTSYIFFERRCCFAVYPSMEAALKILDLVSSVIERVGSLRSARDTVALETLAARAISNNVAMKMGPRYKKCVNYFTAFYTMSQPLMKQSFGIIAFKHIHAKFHGRFDPVIIAQDSSAYIEAVLLQIVNDRRSHVIDVGQINNGAHLLH